MQYSILEQYNLSYILLNRRNYIVRKTIVFISLFLFSSFTFADIGFVQWLKDRSTPELQHMNCIDDVVPMNKGVFVYGISFCDKAINIFKRQPDGSLVFVKSIVNDENQTGIDPKESILISPDDKHLYVSGSTKAKGSFDRAIFIYSIDALTGDLTQIDIFDDWNVLGSEWKMLMSSDGQYIYAYCGWCALCF